MDDDQVLNELRSLGEHLRGQVSPERSRHVAMAALDSHYRRRRSLRWVPAVVGASLFLVGNVALAASSDSALPGELLYPADRAYEWLADLVVTSDRTPERVEEALILAERGETALALQTVEQILGDQADLGMAGLASNSNSAEVLEKVKDLVAAAAAVNTAAQSGDPAALQAAIAAVQQEAAEVAAEASNGQAGGNSNSDDKDNPSVTAPGQVNPPSVTAPGQVEPPSVTAPGQIKDSSTTTSHPGQGQGGGQGGGGGNGIGSGNGQGQGGGNP